MKLKVVVVDLGLSRREKCVAGACVAACVLGAAAIAYAGVPKVWSDGEALNASDLNGDFANLDTRTATLETARTTDEQTLSSQGTAITQLQSTATSGLRQRPAYGGAAAGSTLLGSVNLQSAQLLWQAGSSVVTTNAEGVATVDFSAAFPSGVLTVVITNGDNVAEPGVTFSVNEGVSLSSFPVVAYSPAGTVAPNGVSRVNWVAIGW